MVVVVTGKEVAGKEKARGVCRLGSGRSNENWPTAREISHTEQGNQNRLLAEPTFVEAKPDRG